GHRLLTVLIAIGSLLVALALPATGLIGSSFFPIQDRSEIELMLEMPAGASLEYSKGKAAQVARMARAHPEVDYTFVTVGNTEEAVDEAQVYVRLVPKDERSTSQDELAQM